MFELVRGFEPVAATTGPVYRARVYGRAESDGTWSGWLVFFPVAAGRVVSSGRETVQPTYDDLVLWATTLSDVYLEAALHRALTLEPGAALVDDLALLYLKAKEAEGEAEVAKASAKVHELAAEVERFQAEEAERDATELAATAATVEEAGATAIAEAHESAAHAARKKAAEARSRKRTAKAGGKRASTTRRTTGRSKRG